jgi:MoxR-like ATPase
VSEQENLIESYAEKIRAIQAEIGKVVVGQEEMIRLMMYTLFSKGHILLEGVPGLAKSLAVETFAKVIGGDFNRFQFTPDKMPSDITGTVVWNEKDKKFDVFFGPVFCNIFLADEINRASPKVQSALLQAMQEREVTLECERHKLPRIFMVLATENPIEQIGTYPLAESQVDRFMVKYNVGYPNREEETELIRRKNTNFEDLKEGVRRRIGQEDIRAIQKAVHECATVSSTVMEYIISICLATRPAVNSENGNRGSEIHQYVRLGASPRGTESLLALSKARAFCQGRDFVGFEDVNACAVHVLRHRILLNSQAISRNVTSEMIIEEILKTISPYSVRSNRARFVHTDV